MFVIYMPKEGTVLERAMDLSIYLFLVSVFALALGLIMKTFVVKPIIACKKIDAQAQCTITDNNLVSTLYQKGI